MALYPHVPVTAMARGRIQAGTRARVMGRGSTWARVTGEGYYRGQGHSLGQGVGMGAGIGARTLEL